MDVSKLRTVLPALLTLGLYSCKTLVIPTMTPENKLMPTQLPSPTRVNIPQESAAPSATLSSPRPAFELAQPTSTPSASPSKLDMDAIFPKGPGRELVLYNCLACHGIVRIVTTQRTHGQWQYVKRIMRPRVSTLSDSDADTLFAYLEANFNDTQPVPPLPAWFLEMAPW